MGKPIGPDGTPSCVRPNGTECAGPALVNPSPRLAKAHCVEKSSGRRRSNRNYFNSPSSRDRGFVGDQMGWSFRKFTVAKRQEGESARCQVLAVNPRGLLGALRVFRLRVIHESLVAQ